MTRAIFTLYFAYFHTYTHQEYMHEQYRIEG